MARIRATQPGFVTMSGEDGQVDDGRVGPPRMRNYLSIKNLTYPPPFLLSAALRLLSFSLQTMGPRHRT
jgi:hypothetical protein